jgi:hypothetical protein
MKSRIQIHFILLSCAIFWLSGASAYSVERNVHSSSLPHGVHEASSTTDSDAAFALTKIPSAVLTIRGGGSYFIPSGWNPLGYKITALGDEYLNFDGSLESDLGRFLSSLKSHRKRFPALRDQWVEILRVSKTAQSMRIRRQLEKLLKFALKAGLID